MMISFRESAQLPVRRRSCRRSRLRPPAPYAGVCRPSARPWETSWLRDSVSDNTPPSGGPGAMHGSNTCCPPPRPPASPAGPPAAARRCTSRAGPRTQQAPDARRRHRQRDLSDPCPLPSHHRRTCHEAQVGGGGGGAGQVVVWGGPGSTDEHLLLLEPVSNSNRQRRPCRTVAGDGGDDGLRRLPARLVCLAVVGQVEGEKWGVFRRAVVGSFACLRR